MNQCRKRIHYHWRKEESNDKQDNIGAGEVDHYDA